MAEKEEGEGILLYYKYTKISDINELYKFYEENCISLGLHGRVRISSHGVNVTVGGKMSSLEKHISEVRSKSSLEGIDFKLASCHSISNERVSRECGFDSLSIRIVKELVTFSPHPLLRPPSVANVGRHLSAVEFHSVLLSVGNCMNSPFSNNNKKWRLLDARNLYETRIGQFQTPNVLTLNPQIRQYSDLPAWIDSHSGELHGNNILMYCTGGIRCEMASSYIRSKGEGYENVYQLFGGIQRYMEQFPDGGYFKGKNFVFDPRIAVGSSNPVVLGSCLLCCGAFDDYTSRCRCIHCRMLVLVCNSCQEKDTAYVCELCQKHGKRDFPLTLKQEDKVQDELDCVPVQSISVFHGNEPQRKLRIVCLHGFRQNASSFKGRTASLTKKLKNIAEFVFIDAPHQLPFIYQPDSTNVTLQSEQMGPPLLPPENCKKKFAWLIDSEVTCSTGTEWKVASVPFDPLQYQKQKGGFETSFNFLNTVIQKMGPIDGLLGFSQGAAMAAGFCAKKEKDVSPHCFRFVILCSGYALDSANLEAECIKLPSLHIFGGCQGKDRQITHDASRKLTGMFDKDCSVILEHESGHIIPTQSPYIEHIKDFLGRFL